MLMDYQQILTEIVRIGAVALAALIARYVVLAIRTLHSVVTHMLPHFVPPPVSEQLNGAQDNTVPARLARVEARQVVLGTHQTTMDQRFTDHLDAEEAAEVAKADTAARQSRALWAALRERKGEPDAAQPLRLVPPPDAET